MKFCTRRGFTLVELLVVIGIIALLTGILLPAISRTRQSSMRTTCLANIRNLCVAQAAYAVEYKNLLVAADEGSYNVQGSWIGYLEGAYTHPLARRCPADDSRYYGQTLPGSSPRSNRMTSYAINNYVSPTHAPEGVEPVRKITQVGRAAAVIQFVELAESGECAGSDHIHAQDFYFAIAPQPNVTLGLIARQMPVGRHGGRFNDWEALLNYGFLDGHAESLRVSHVYTDPQRNHFDPAVAN